MPIVYRETETEKSFVLEDPTPEEKQAIFEIACEQITGLFGKQVADSIIRSAAEYHILLKSQEEGSDGEDVEGSAKIYTPPTLN